MSITWMRPALAGLAVLCLHQGLWADGQFTITRVGPLGQDPFAIATSDINGDGKLDLAVTNYSSSSLSLLYGAGNGTFGGRIDYTVGVTPGGVAAGDFNRDGRIDFATTAEYGYAVTVLYGQPTGGLGQRQDFPADHFSRHMITADLNGDGLLDMATACISSSAVSVYYGQVSGGFAPRQNLSTAYNPIGITAADFNQDGLLDIATTNRGYQGHDQISILFGQSGGGFASHVDYDSQAGGDPDPRGIVAADFNRDGRLDLAVANRSTNNIGIAYGLPAGGFSDPLILLVGTHPYGLVAADFDMDGSLDIAASLDGASKVTLLRGRSDGSFAAPEDYLVAAYPTELVAADFNGDGGVDLAVADHDGVAILTNVVPEPATLALLALAGSALLTRRRR